MNYRTLARCALAGASCLALAAHAGRPLQTEDAGVLEARACEIEGAWLRLSADERSTERTLGVGCGIGVSSQIGLGLASTSFAGETTRSLALGGKTALGSAAGADLTLAWSVGADRTGGRWEHSSTELALVASVALPASSLHLNLGHSRDVVSRLASTTWGVALEHEGYALGAWHWAPMAELFGDDRDGAWWNLGLRLAVLPERLFLDLSWGRHLSGARERLVTAGFKLAF